MMADEDQDLIEGVYGTDAQARRLMAQLRARLADLPPGVPAEAQRAIAAVPDALTREYLRRAANPGHARAVVDMAELQADAGRLQEAKSALLSLRLWHEALARHLERFRRDEDARRVRAGGKASGQSRAEDAEDIRRWYWREAEKMELAGMDARNIAAALARKGRSDDVFISRCRADLERDPTTSERTIRKYLKAPK